jgi:hypothetical protein
MAVSPMALRGSGCIKQVESRMPYHALELDQLPKLSAEEVLVRHGIHVMAVENVSEVDESIQKVFLETKRSSRLAGITTLSAYIDSRPSGRYPKTHMG